MSILDIFRRKKSPEIVVRPSRPKAKRPEVGDPVWWSPKQLPCVITQVNPDGSFIFQGGPIIKNARGRQTPRWTVNCPAPGGTVIGARGRLKNIGPLWDARIPCWIVGQGPTPKPPRGLVLHPDPVQMSGQATGSFAINPRDISNG